MSEAVQSHKEIFQYTYYCSTVTDPVAGSTGIQQSQKVVQDVVYGIYPPCVPQILLCNFAVHTCNKKKH